MGLSISGTTVSVAESTTKSVTASVGAKHGVKLIGRIVADGKTYYAGAQPNCSTWINWT